MTYKTLLLISLINILPLFIHANIQNNTKTEPSSCNQPDCVRCDLEHGLCMKCLYVMMEETRLCIKQCPSGFSTSWAHTDQFMGRICTERSWLGRISGRDILIIGAAAIGGAICVGVVLGAFFYMRKKSKPFNSINQTNYQRYYKAPWTSRDKRINITEMTVDREQRLEFLDQLNSLRGESNNFLQMLNETRNKFRTIGPHDSATDTKSKAYRAVVRDLSRVLSLLNRREDQIKTVPADWRRLLSWASRVLARYKRMKHAKESGEISYLDPMPGLGGSLYQTRQQQLKAERERLAAKRLMNMCSPSSSQTNLTDNECQGSNGTPPKDTESTIVSLTTTDMDCEAIQKPKFQIGEKLMPLNSLTPITLLASMTSDDSLTNRELAEMNGRNQMYYGGNRPKQDLQQRMFRSRANSLTSTYEEHSKRLKNSMTTTSTFANKYHQLWKQNNRSGSLSLFTSKCEDLIPNTLNRNFWNRFTLSKSCTNLNEADVGIETTEIKENDTNDYIPSPTLFDHIETFSFDDILTASSSKTNSPASSVKKSSVSPMKMSTSKLDYSDLLSKSKEETKADLEKFSNQLNQKLLNQLEPKKIQVEVGIEYDNNNSTKLIDDTPKNMNAQVKKKKTLHERRLENSLVNKSMVGGDMYISVTKNRIVKRPPIKLRKKYFKEDSFSYKKNTTDSFRDNNSLNSSGNESISSWNDSISSGEESLHFSSKESVSSSTKDSLQTTEPSTPDLIQEDVITYDHKIRSLPPATRCDFTINV